jgi:hypothetical protein
VFFKGIGISGFLWGWGIIQRVVSWVAWEGEVWFFSRQEGDIFLIFQRIILLVVWDGVFGESRWGVFFFCFFLL